MSDDSHCEQKALRTFIYRLAIPLMLFLFLGYSLDTEIASENRAGEVETLSIMIHTPDESRIFEGDRIACTITGARERYWTLSDSASTGDRHHTFVGDDPLLIDMEQFTDDSVTLTVNALNDREEVSKEVRIIPYKIYWGDSHLHADVGDFHAREKLDTLLSYAAKYKADNEWWALDWFVSQSHAFRSFLWEGTPGGGWSGRRDVVNKYNDPGNLTVFMGAEYSPKPACSLVMHLTVIYSGDCYDLDVNDMLCAAKTHPNAARSAQEVIDRCWWIVNNTDNDIILYPHHMTAHWYYQMWGGFDNIWNYWDPVGRDRFIRGVELVSKHGNNMDHYTDGVPAIKNASCGHGSKDRFVEYAVKSWSDQTSGLGTERVFGFHASTDWHQLKMRASNIGTKDGPLGRMGVWAKYNDRENLFAGMKQGMNFAGDYQNVNLNLQVDGQHAFGNWIDIDGKADVEVFVWARKESDAEVRDLYLVHCDASNSSIYCNVIDHVQITDEDLAPGYFYYKKSVDVEACDALWVTTRSFNLHDSGLDFDGDGHPSVPRNPYRTWSSPVWIKSVR